MLFLIEIPTSTVSDDAKELAEDPIVYFVSLQPPLGLLYSVL